MTNQQHPDRFDWATELSDAQGHVTLSEQEAHEIGARLRRLHSENETRQAGYAAARLEIESLQARINTMAEEHADELMVAHLDGRMRAAQPAGAQQPAKAESLRQILTDPENQPNQYGVQFLMHGAKMAFRIGNRQFCLDYEPDEPGEFEFMRDALISAFSIFTPDVKLAQQPSPTPQADSQPAPVQDYPPLPDFDTVEQHIYGACRRYITQDMLEPIHNLIRETVDADRAARAPADSVLEDAARWQTFIALPYATRAEWASNLSLAPVLTQWVDAARKQGANHD